MGYLTYFMLNKIEGTDKDFEALMEDIERETGMDFASACDDCIEGKWYDYGENMCRLTKKYPDLLVELYGDGENSDDQWAARYRNGEEEHVSFIRDDVHFHVLTTEEEKRQNTERHNMSTLNVIIGLDEANLAFKKGQQEAAKLIARLGQGKMLSVTFSTPEDAQKTKALLDEIYRFWPGINAAAAGEQYTTLYLFYGSLSVIQILENDCEFHNALVAGMTKAGALTEADNCIRRHFEKENTEWDYNLDVHVETFQNNENLEKNIDSTISWFERGNRFEEEDGSGNAQGFTSYSRSSN